MPIEQRRPLHSDLGPSSKDWQPGSPGRDEDFTPEKDLWTLSRKGDLGEGRPGEDIHSAGEPGSRPEGTGEDVQPGTQEPGKSWQSETPNPDDEEEILEATLEDTFPASDPVAPSGPATGWVSDEAAERAGGKRE